MKDYTAEVEMVLEMHKGYICDDPLPYAYMSFQEAVLSSAGLAH